MTTDKQDAVQRAVERVAKQHGLIDCAFCGEEKETGNFFGFFVDSKANIGNMWGTVLNVGRLWQHVRTSTREALNVFEKKGWK